MKRFSILFLLLTGLSSSFVAAQSVPGYLGSRWSIGYNAYLSPAILNPTTAKEPVFSTNEYGDMDLEHSIGVNMQHNLVVEYVLSKRQSLVGNLLVSRNAMRPFESYDYVYNEIAFDEYPQMAATGFVLGYRIYREHFSPLGKYLEYRLGYSRVASHDFTYSYAPQEYQQGSNTPTRAPAEIHTVEGSSTGMFILGIGWGVNRMVTENVMISFGGAISAALGGSAGYYSGMPWEGPFTMEPGDNTEENQYILLNQARTRFFFESIMNFKLGVSYLL